MRQFTNIERSEAKAFQVYVAALRSGLNVKYIDAPMPPDGDWGYGAKVSIGHYNYYASLANYSGQYDLSAFWREMDKLED